MICTYLHITARALIWRTNEIHITYTSALTKQQIRCNQSLNCQLSKPLIFNASGGNNIVSDNVVQKKIIDVATLSFTYN